MDNDTKQLLIVCLSTLFAISIIGGGCNINSSIDASVYRKAMENGYCMAQNEGNNRWRWVKCGKDVEK